MLGRGIWLGTGDSLGAGKSLGATDLPEVSILPMANNLSCAGYSLGARNCWGSTTSISLEDTAWGLDALGREVGSD